MPIEVRKKTDESMEAMIRRFTKRVQQSGIIWRVRRGRFFEAAKSKNEKRKDTLRRIEINSRQEYLRKIGKLDESDFRGGRNNRSRNNSTKKKR